MSKQFCSLLVRASAFAAALIILLFVAVACVPQGGSGSAAQPPTASTFPSAAQCEDGVQASGARYRICMPTGFLPWNRDLLVYAHGYVAASAPIAIPEDQLRLPDGTYLPDQVTFFGYAFATTSYSVNGLAVKEALADLADLVDIFRSRHSQLRNVYLVGVSEGGLITVLGIERFAHLYAGGIAACGPIGDFRGQTDYFGDFRVVFDYFFPGLMPGSAISIPQSLMNSWDTHFQTVILPVIADPANAISVTQLFSVTGAAYDPADPLTKINTIRGVLWYNVFATNDAVAKLGGNPYDNRDRIYAGSLDDAALNAGVARFAAAVPALNEIEVHYQTAGTAPVPLVTMHTTGDEIVPYWHETRHRAKVIANRRSEWHRSIAAPRYGHCNFLTTEVITALTTLQELIANPPRYTARLPLVMR